MWIPNIPGKNNIFNYGKLEILKNKYIKPIIIYSINGKMTEK
jgi:hypothetical protein